MNLKYREKENYLVVDLEGEITAANSMKLMEEIKGLTAEGKKNLLINLHGVSYVDSTGLGLMVAIHDAMKKSQGKMALMGINRPEIQNLFKITQLSRFFKIYDDENIAMGDFC